jgi:wyosine [tRNA(Phe)-imidazoG37] synthetase (radical SAM superfamily)
MTRAYQYLFGPVPSRRLGRSLGIDLVRYKTCSFDCVYCQLGRTTEKTVHRAEYVPTRAVISELKRKLKEKAAIDYLTFSGSGEPTLHIGIGRIIQSLKEISSIPVAVLTNSSLLWMPEVQEALAHADLVLPTLSSARPESFRKIHRPASELNLKKIIEGLAEFRSNFSGQIWLEVFIVRGLNDNAQEMQALLPALEKISPDKIQLNTSARLPAEEYSLAVSEAELVKLARILGPRAEIVADFRKKSPAGKSRAGSAEVLNFLKRRPATARDIAAGLGISLEDAARLLKRLLARKKIASRTWGKSEEFFPVRPD